MAIWTGLGGYVGSASNLTQIGVFQENSSYSPADGGVAEFVWQQVAASGQATQLFNFGPTVHPGDKIYVSVQWAYGIGPREAQFFAEDITTGYNREFLKAVPYIVSTTSADYIYECPAFLFDLVACQEGLLGPGYGLYGPNPINFVANQYADGQGQFILSRTNDNVYMNSDPSCPNINTGPYQMTTSSPVNVTDGSFSVTVQHLQADCLN